ncbi:PDZ-binding protein, CRIPT, partial [Kipferlia bialata]
SKDLGEKRKGGAAQRTVSGAEQAKTTKSYSCRICGRSLPGKARYCQQCAYSGGVCNMCGRAISGDAMKLRRNR